MMENMHEPTAFDAAAVRALPSDKLKTIAKTLDGRIHSMSGKAQPGDYDVYNLVKTELDTRTQDEAPKSGRQLLEDAFKELFSAQDS